ncbi:thiopurine S-methyltransferase [Acinetobacter sp. S40]|uniref:thiopurine S-methyltransferase n=1 Tax=Acinetobacter sp. S40 TaxID=2767434 RepID=UPI00190D46D4|nr:thiopurine S-methyltransferase [Acinetobacter sp. S40]MBJ9985637.1 thiopurine S-methyltransferase [Acinetobacter sp. S40]
MQHEFWHQRWQENRIGFHQLTPSPLLVAHWSELHLKTKQRVFVPLSGKTLDIRWLIQQGFRVVAIELSQIAVVALIEQLTQDFNFDFKISEQNDLIHYSHPQIDIYVGDFFDLAKEQLGQVDAIYDRAALIALPKDMRRQYTKHLIQISQTAPQFLISYEYDQNSFEGPPFSVEAKEVQQLYSPFYQVRLLKEQFVDPEGNKGKNPRSKVWLLTARS